MSRRCIAARFVALFSALSLALPASSFGMRVETPIEGHARSGLEERLGGSPAAETERDLRASPATGLEELPVVFGTEKAATELFFGAEVQPRLKRDRRAGRYVELGVESGKLGVRKAGRKAPDVDGVRSRAEALNQTNSFPEGGRVVIVQAAPHSPAGRHPHLLAVQGGEFAYGAAQEGVFYLTAPCFLEAPPDLVAEVIAEGMQAPPPPAQPGESLTERVARSQHRAERILPMVEGSLAEIERREGERIERALTREVPRSYRPHAAAMAQALVGAYRHFGAERANRVERMIRAVGQTVREIDDLADFGEETGPIRELLFGEILPLAVGTYRDRPEFLPGALVELARTGAQLPPRQFREYLERYARVAIESTKYEIGVFSSMDHLRAILESRRFESPLAERGGRAPGRTLKPLVREAEDRLAVQEATGELGRKAETALVPGEETPEGQAPSTEVALGRALEEMTYEERYLFSPTKFPLANSPDLR